MKIGGRLSRFAMATFLLGVLLIVGFGMAETVHAEPIYQVKIIAQLTICHPPIPCFLATLKAHAQGYAADNLAGTLLIFPRPGSRSRVTPACMADMTGFVTQGSSTEGTVTLTGTLHGPLRLLINVPCSGDLQGTPVTLSGNNFDGSITLTTPSLVSTGVITLAEGTGTVIIQFPPELV